ERARVLDRLDDEMEDEEGAECEKPDDDGGFEAEPPLARKGGPKAALTHASSCRHSLRDAGRVRGPRARRGDRRGAGRPPPEARAAGPPPARSAPPAGGARRSRASRRA